MSKYAVLKTINTIDLGTESQQNFIRLVDSSVDYIDTTERIIENKSITFLIDMSLLAAAPPAQIRDAIKDQQLSGWNLCNQDILMININKASLL